MLVDGPFVESKKNLSLRFRGSENQRLIDVPASLAAKLSLLWDSVPEQLAKENRKFIFAEVQKNMRARDLEDAMDWLIRAGLVYRTPRINEAAIPISAYRDGAFKLYVSDVGLLGAKVGLDISVLVENYNLTPTAGDAIADIKTIMGE